MGFISYYTQKKDTIDTHWHCFTQIQFDWILSQLQNHYAHDAQFTLLDLGCGTGRLLEQIAHQFPQATLHGVDGTPAMIHKSRERLKGQVALIQANLDSFTPMHNYNVIISTTVMHHLNDIHHHLKIIRYYTVDNAFISEFAINTLPLILANQWWKAAQSSHKQAWSCHGFQKLLNENHFTIANKAVLKPDRFWRLQIYNLQT